MVFVRMNYGFHGNSRPIGYFHVMLALLNLAGRSHSTHSFDLAAGGASYCHEPNGDMTKSCPGPGFIGLKMRASSASERLGR